MVERPAKVGKEARTELPRHCDAHVDHKARATLERMRAIEDYINKQEDKHDYEAIEVVMPSSLWERDEAIHILVTTLMERDLQMADLMEEVANQNAIEGTSACSPSQCSLHAFKCVCDRRQGSKICLSSGGL